MKVIFKKIKYFLLSTVCIFSIGPVNALAQAASSDIRAETSVALKGSSLTEQFTPRPSVDTKLDFENWDRFLSSIVLYMGPAVRKRAPKIIESGTRLILRDDSPYRFEGNKIVYTLMHKDEKAWLKQYVRDLEALSNRTDITTLPRADQLAFWYNLHNAAVISTIANNYPVRSIDRLTPFDNDPTLLHDVKILNISGAALSLRDIREKIVYPNWKNPIVAYGFHHGNLGGPAIALRAYERDRLLPTLSRNADEFINSFRSYRAGKISLFYQDISPFYFPNGESDIRAHLRRNMRPEVYKSVESYETLRWHRPMLQVTDIAGGVGFGTSPTPVARVGQGAAGLPPAFQEFAKARAERIQIARQRGLRRGRVVIEDINNNLSEIAEPLN